MKSFAEIQEEERGAKQSHAEEVEFMRWWQEEEARVSSESGANGNTKGQRGGRGVPRGHQRRVPNRGRGRGVGQSGQAEAGGRGRKPEAPSKQAVSTGNPVRS